MTAPKIRTTYKGGARYYIHPDTGETVPGVTSIIGMLPKPFLQYWAAKEVATAAVTQYHLIGQMLEHGPEGAIDYLKGTPGRTTKEAANRGTAAHSLFEAIELGEDVSYATGEIAEYGERFRAILQQLQPTGYATEVTVWSERYGYAGSADAIWEIGGEYVIVDHKTSKSIYPEVALQLSAYAHADYAIDKVGNRLPLPKITRGLALHYPREGGWAIYEVPIGDEVFETFRALQVVFEWHRQESKVIRQPLFVSDQAN